MAQADFDSFTNTPYLNQNEQNLLLNALTSNKPTSSATQPAESGLNPNMAHLSSDFGSFDPSVLDADFANDFTSWDLGELRKDNGQPSSQSADNDADGDGDGESPDSQQDGKRKDRDGDDSQDDGNKRHEGDEKVAKKPGRKPLTSEPTSKRKAQNRAAQRAFRERKEKHLRDLETKVDDLEKASEATNHENGILRDQVDKLQAELAEYKKRLTSTANPAGYSPSSTNKVNWDINQNFNFEFPSSFGLGTSNEKLTAHKAKECKNSLNALKALEDLERTSAEQNFYKLGNSMSYDSSSSPASAARSMSMSTSTGGSMYLGNKKPGRSPTNSTQTGSITASPASLGLGSSCVTTPEASVDSPQTKLIDNNASASPQPKTPGQDASLDWFTTQSNGVFDPILFGDYREPQDNILNNADFGLNDFDSTFPWNLDSTVSGPWSPTGSLLEPVAQPKKSLIDHCDAAALGSNMDEALKQTNIESGDTKSQLTCAKLWDRVQRSEKVLSGEADMDDLCSQLKAKAKCGGPNKGAVVAEADVDAILGPDPAKKKQNQGMRAMFG